MSYDIYIGSDSFNYTWNLAPLFHTHINSDRDGDKNTGLQCLDGLTGKEALPILERFWTSLERERLVLWRNKQVGEPRLSDKYDSDNGWGSLIGALILIGLLQSACSRNRKSKIKVS